MTKLTLRREAIKLRRQGKSYNQIRDILDVSKSSLSQWLNKMPLSDTQMKQLRDWSAVRIEKFRLTMARKKTQRLENVLKRSKKELLPLSQRELFLSGLMLYWGEGEKKTGGAISISNTDPQVIKFGLYCILRRLNKTKIKIKIYLHLYSDMDVKKEMQYWSQELKIPLSQFTKPYIKKNKRTDIDERGFGHGTCRIVVSDVHSKEKIMMGIKAIADYYGSRI